MRIARQGRTWRAIAVAAAATTAVGVAVPALAVSARAVAGGTGAARVLGAGQTGTKAQVPWSRVGPEWSLALYSARQGGEGIKPKAGPSTLYLVDPAGGRYRLVTWAAHSPQTSWYLQGWSGDMRRAMLVPASQLYNTYVRQHVYQLQLRTGKISGFILPAHVSSVGYTRPDGLNILAQKSSPRTNTVTLQRYSLTGKLQATLATVPNFQGTAYQPAGAQLAVGVRRGLELVSNAGGVIRQLPVPHIKDGCSPVRWWTSREILATCTEPGLAGGNMWLVPATGGAPTVLTPPRRHSTFDLGDFNAWQLSSGLYVDGVSACATLVIGRQPARGPEQQIHVPGAPSSLIITATRTRLLVERFNGCNPGTSLVWLNPATRKLTVAVPVSGQQWGVTSVVPFFVAGKF
jgi:hypothetical protein